MKFKLDFPIDRNPVINYKNPVMSIGSCFAESVAQKLKDCRFEVLINPNGIIYNPISLADVFREMGKSILDSNVMHYEDLWHSWNHHGSFSSLTKEELVEKVQAAKASVNEFLKKKRGTVLVTFGSAHAYCYQGEIVANCHKVPAANFKKKLLTVSEIAAVWNKILSENSALNFVFTVSPVRYKRDGLHQNNLSKSTLHLAIDELVRSNKNACYFPAYEIVMDELRDYRFYGKDLVHVSDEAIDYVWSRFKDAMLNDASRRMVTECEKLNQLMNHRIIHPDLASSKKLVQARIEAETFFEKKYFTI